MGQRAVCRCADGCQCLPSQASPSSRLGFPQFFPSPTTVDEEHDPHSSSNRPPLVPSLLEPLQGSYHHLHHHHHLSPGLTTRGAYFLNRHSACLFLPPQRPQATGRVASPLAEPPIATRFPHRFSCNRAQAARPSSPRTQPVTLSGPSDHRFSLPSPSLPFPLPGQKRKEKHISDIAEGVFL